MRLGISLAAVLVIVVRLSTQPALVLTGWVRKSIPVRTLVVALGLEHIIPAVAHAAIVDHELSAMAGTLDAAWLLLDGRRDVRVEVVDRAAFVALVSDTVLPARVLAVRVGNVGPPAAGVGTTALNDNVSVAVPVILDHALRAGVGALNARFDAKVRLGVLLAAVLEIGVGLAPSPALVLAGRVLEGVPLRSGVAALGVQCQIPRRVAVLVVGNHLVGPVIGAFDAAGFFDGRRWHIRGEVLNRTARKIFVSRVVLPARVLTIGFRRLGPPASEEAAAFGKDARMGVAIQVVLDHVIWTDVAALNASLGGSRCSKEQK